MFGWRRRVLFFFCSLVIGWHLLFFFFCVANCSYYILTFLKSLLAQTGLLLADDILARCNSRPFPVPWCSAAVFSSQVFRWFMTVQSKVWLHCYQPGGLDIVRRFTSNPLLTCHWDYCELRPPTLCWILLQKSPVSAHPGQSRRNSPSMAERKDPHNQGKGSRWSCDLYCTRLWDPPEMFPYVCENISSSLYKLHVRSCGEVELVDLACSVKSLVTKISSVGG